MQARQAAAIRASGASTRPRSGPTAAKTVAKVSAAADPKIDCFYVYPTVSEQPTPNADLAVDPAEIGVAVAQAERYSQVCRVFAPIYRQGTIASLASRSAESGKIAFNSLLSAWKDYLARYNDGRGIVLIGHSQGSFILRQLIAKYIEPDATLPPDRLRHPARRQRDVPAGKDVGGDFKYLAGAPQRDAARLCDRVSRASTRHRRPTRSSAAPKGEQVLCTNPTALGGGSGPVDPYFPAHRMNSVISFDLPRV